MRNWIKLLLAATLIVGSTEVWGAGPSGGGPGPSPQPVGTLGVLAVGKSVNNPGTGKGETLLPIQIKSGANYAFGAADLQLKTRRTNLGSAMADTFPAAGTVGLVNGALIDVINVDGSSTDTITAGAGTTIDGLSSFSLGPSREVWWSYDSASTAWRAIANTKFGLFASSSITGLVYANGLSPTTSLGVGSGLAIVGGNLTATGLGGTVTTVSVASANGFTGTVANATTTPAITIIAGAITPTSVNGITLIGSSSGFSIQTNKTVTFGNSVNWLGTDATTMTTPATTTTLAGLTIAETWSANQTFGPTNLIVKGSSTGVTTLGTANAGASNFTMTLPAATDTFVGKATTDILTNKTFDTAGTGNVFKINGTTISSNTGTGANVLASAPSIASPTFTGTVAGAGTIPLSILQNSAAFSFVGNATNATAVNTAMNATAAQGVLFPGNPWAGYLNVIRNPGFQVNQRGTAAITVTAGATGAYTADGMLVTFTGANGTVTPGIGQPANQNSPNAMTITGNTSVTDATLKLRVESLDSLSLNFKIIVCQLGVTNNTGGTITPTIAIKHPNSADNFSALTTDLAATNVTAITNGSQVVEAYVFGSVSVSTGMEVDWDFGNNFSSNAKSVDVWAADCRYAPSALAIGVTTTPPLVEYPPYAIDLLHNQRYLVNRAFVNSQNTGIGTYDTTTAYFEQFRLPVPMRVRPTGITFTGTIANIDVLGGIALNAASAVAFQSSDTTNICIQWTTAATVSGTTAFLQSISGTNSILITGAEL